MKNYKKIVLTSLILIFSVCILGFIYVRSNKPNEKLDVSVIVPVYNVEKYLDECLDSIENQTKKDGVEIICINDGSKDKSAEILKNHADKNDKIKVITQENRGLSAARNEGMKVAKGKYIMFVDSDDIIVPCAIEQAYKTAEKYNVDIVKFRREFFNDGDLFDVSKITYNKSKIWVSTRKDNENPFKVWHDAETTGPVWNKFWKREFLEKNNLIFKEGIIFEDCLFLWTAFPQTKKIAYNENILYGYRVNREGSIVNESMKNVRKHLENNLIIFRELINQHYRIKFDDSDNWILESILGISYGKICNKLDNDIDKYTYARRYLELIDEFIKKYDVIVSEENKTKIDNLRILAENI